MAFQRGIDGSDPVRAQPVERLDGMREERCARSTRLAVGTLACPACDAPVLPSGPVAPSDAMACPYCRHGAPAHLFLSLSGPLRPARVEVRVVRRALV